MSKTSDRYVKVVTWSAEDQCYNSEAAFRGRTQGFRLC